MSAVIINNIELIIILLSLFVFIIIILKLKKDKNSNKTAFLWFAITGLAVITSFILKKFPFGITLSLIEVFLWLVYFFREKKIKVMWFLISMLPISIAIIVNIKLTYFLDYKLNIGGHGNWMAFIGGYAGGVIALVGIWWQMKKSGDEELLGILKTISGSIEENLMKFPIEEIKKMFTFVIMINKKNLVLEYFKIEFYLSNEMRFQEKQKLYHKKLEEFIYLERSLKSLQEKIKYMKEKGEEYFENFEKLLEISKKFSNTSFKNLIDIISDLNINIYNFNLEIYEPLFLNSYNAKLDNIKNNELDIDKVREEINSLKCYTPADAELRSLIISNNKKLFSRIEKGEKLLEYRLVYYLFIVMHNIQYELKIEDEKTELVKSPELREEAEKRFGVLVKIRNTIYRQITDIFELHAIFYKNTKISPENLYEKLTEYKTKLDNEINKLEKSFL
ncbi:MAG: hypothetical protein ACRCSK_07045 [Fusobacteriaceae bacterium]